MKIVWLVVGGLAAVSILGCGSGAGAGSTATSRREKPPVAASNESAAQASSKGRRELHISLDNWEGPENIGVLMAEAKGYFKNEGLAVIVTRAVTPRNPLRYVSTGLVQLGLAPEPQVVMAREKGVPIVAIGSLLPRSTEALIWLKGSGIHGVEDLEGKTIATPGFSYQRTFLEAALASQGVSPENVTIRGFGHGLVPALLKGKADAIFGGSWNLEGAALKARGLEPVILRGQDLGLPNYDESVVIARSDQLSGRAGLFRAFMSAVARGTEAAVADPKQAAEVILNALERNGEVGRKATAAQLRATLPLLSTSGRMDDDRAAGLVEWMGDEGIIEAEPAVEDLLRDDYLPAP